MGDSKKKNKLITNNQKLIIFLLFIFDIVSVNLSYFLALLIRFDGIFSKIDVTFLDAFKQYAPVNTVLSIVIFILMGMYSSVWKYASVDEAFRTCIGSITASVIHSIIINIAITRMPVSYIVWGGCFQLLLTVFVRFFYRIAVFERNKVRKKSHKLKNVMVIGAGDAGQMIIKDIQQNTRLNDIVRCVIDDDRNKTGRKICGIPIVGSRDDILYYVKKYDIDKIYIAIPSASVRARQDIINICNEAGCELKNLPGISQLVRNTVTVNNLMDVSVEDLLGRDPISTNMKEVFDFISNKTILVTGGGGSIGSELCRQIAKHSPKQLIIFDIYENNAYDIQLELRDKHPELNLVIIIGSVRDSRRLDYVFSKYHPDVVYHAAAHKHVPLMEDSPCESIKNNAIGTYKTAYTAMKYNVQRFVLISTDKAVNPTNIMGASKRLCEMIIQSFDKKIRQGKVYEIDNFYTHGEDDKNCADSIGKLPADVKTEFVAVRFGNVLGSNGSVIPIFKRQIAKGGPVTVTHPDIIRYFMTIPEAVSLVLLAGTYAHGGEIFVLDMGEPVKIDLLARNLIKLSGYKPDVDIKIEYSGLRPGEKLYEEKLMDEEDMGKTSNELIHIGKPIDFDTDLFLKQLYQLMIDAYNNCDDIKNKVSEVVDTYKIIS